MKKIDFKFIIQEQEKKFKIKIKKNNRISLKVSIKKYQFFLKKFIGKIFLV